MPFVTTADGREVGTTIGSSAPSLLSRDAVPTMMTAATKPNATAAPVTYSHCEPPAARRWRRPAGLRFAIAISPGPPLSSYGGVSGWGLGDERPQTGVQRSSRAVPAQMGQNPTARR